VAKSAAGRPTKLDDNARGCAYKYAGGDWQMDGDVVPSVEGLAIYLGVSRSTVKLWASQDDEFSATVEGIKSIQARKLINLGLSGEFNSAITKLLLNNHGYTEKVETQNTHSFESLSDEELAAKIQSFNS
jgi:hypothetical protein